MERFEKDLAGTGPCLRVWQIQEGLLKFQALHTGRAKDDNTQPTAQLDNPPITQISPIYSGRRKAEGRGQRAEGRRQKAEGGRQKAEGGSRKAEGRRQRAENRKPSSA